MTDDGAVYTFISSEPALGRLTIESDNSRPVVVQGKWTTKVQRRANGGFDLSESPSHLIRRCAQYFGDLYAHEASSNELTKQIGRAHV